MITRGSYDVHKRRCLGGGGGSIFFLCVCVYKLISTVEPRYNEVLGIMKITLLYQGKKTKKYKEVGSAELTCYKRVLLYPTSL